MVDLLQDSYWYEAPFLSCGIEPYHVGCASAIPLPYDNLPQTDHELLRSQETSQLVLPLDEWQVFSGCRDCGLVAIRGRAHLDADIVAKESEGRFRADAPLHVVEFPCANTSCKAPAKMYVDIPDGTVEGLLAEMKEGRFHGVLPCGHPIKPVPSQKCAVRQVLNRLW